MSHRYLPVKSIHLEVSETLIETLTGSLSLLQLIIEEKSDKNSEPHTKYRNEDHIEFLKLIESQFSNLLKAIQEKYHS